MMFMSREVSLYSIQEKIVSALRDAMRTDKRVVLKAATGVGKTIIATWITKQAMEKGKRILFVCDRISLIHQTSHVFSGYGIDHGIYQADNPMWDPMLPVQIGSIQTLARRKQKVYDLIFLDECHYFFKAHGAILNHNPDAYVIGLSATPFTKGLGKHFSRLIEPVPMKDLIRMGYLCEFEIYGPETINLNGVRTVAGEYREDDLATAADKPQLVADIVTTWKMLGNAKTIVFCVNVAHGRHLEKEFRKNGINAREINGYMPKDGFDGANQIIQDFRDGKFQVLISCEMLVKGFDVPDVGCVQFATATKSPIKWIQACGRGLRVSDGKTICKILDHGSNAVRLGFPDEFEFIRLDDGKKQDPKTVKKEKPEKMPKKCPSCDFIKPAGLVKCPRCGLVAKHFEAVETEAGELKKLQRKDRSEYTLEQKQSFLAQLNDYAAQKNFKPGKGGCYGWAIHQYTKKFGAMPSSKILWSAREPLSREVQSWITHTFIKQAKSPAPTRCYKCNSTVFKITDAGPHRKLICGKCGNYLKFVNAQQEQELKNKKQIMEEL